jgi:hypothetical protein
VIPFDDPYVPKPDIRDMYLSEAKAAETVSALPTDADRVWILFVHTYSTQPSAVLHQALQHRYMQVKRYVFDGVDVFVASPKIAQGELQRSHTRSAQTPME